MIRLGSMAIAIALPGTLAFSAAAVAQTAAPGNDTAQPVPGGNATSELDAVIVTANPLGSGLFDLVPPRIRSGGPGTSVAETQHAR